MARKTQQSIDGISIDLSKGRFANTFDIAEGDERYVATDEEVVFVVIARVDSVRFAPTKGGDHVRVNALKVQEARLIRDEDQKTKLLERFRFGYKPQPSLFDFDDEDKDEAKDESLPVRFVEPDEDEDFEVEPDLDAEVDEIDREMREFLDAAKRIADEYEEEESEPLPPGQSRVVGEAKGLAEKDPILKNFLSV
jgi:hypothetical protein